MSGINAISSSVNPTDSSSTDPLLDNSDPLDPLSPDNIQQDVADANQAAIQTVTQQKQDDLKATRKRSTFRRVAEANQTPLQIVQPPGASGASGPTGGGTTSK